MKCPPDWRQQLREAYPKRQGQGWTNVGKQIHKHIENGESWDEMLAGANAYRRYIAQTETEPAFIKMAATFFGPGLWWLEYDEDEGNEITLDDQANEFNLIRQENENDESLKARIGVAMTKRQYG